MCQESRCLVTLTFTDETPCLNFSPSRPRHGSASGTEQDTSTLPPMPGPMSRWGQASLATLIASTMKRTGSSLSTCRKHHSWSTSKCTKPTSLFPPIDYLEVSFGRNTAQLVADDASMLSLFCFYDSFSLSF